MGTGLLAEGAARRAVLLGIVALCVLGHAACGAVSFLSSDPAADGNRRAPFDRFADELFLALMDTAPPLERARLADRADELRGARWDEARRVEARRRVQQDALRRLESEFGRLGSQRARQAKVLADDLREALRTVEAPIAGGAAPGGAGRDRSVGRGSSVPSSVAGLVTTPWSGELIEAPSVLLREHPRTTVSDLLAWWDAIESLALRLEEFAPAPGRSTAIPTELGGRRLVLERVYADVIALGGSAGAGGPGDPLLGPLQEAAGALRGPDSLSIEVDRRRRVQNGLRSSLEGLAELLDAARVVADQDPGARRRRTEGRPLVGVDRDRWIRALRDVTGPAVDTDALSAIGRREVERLTRGLGFSLALERPESIEAVRVAFAEVRERTRSLPGAGAPPRSPDSLWAAIEPQLDGFIEDPPPVAVSFATARRFERPHGRWSPFVRGNLVPANDPRARPSLFLEARAKDPTTPTWMREAEALRYGIPGRALLDAFRRAAEDTPKILLTTPREALEEGWGLYALQAAAELDLVPELDAGFGRLAQELVAFAALVVDLGIHGDGWPETEGVDYLLEVTPLPRSAATDLVVRIQSAPGRTALPAIGALRLRALRRSGESALGEAFEPAEFHRALLLGGPVPLAELDQRMADWLRERGKRRAE